ncbi:MAG: acetyltransferase [Burkholderiales bacterium]
MRHVLRPLLAPSSVALVGASERPGSLGRIVMENLLEGEFAGEFHAVNPAHRTLLGRKAWPNLAAIGRPVELVVVAVPCEAVPRVIADAALAKARAAILMTAARAGDDAVARRWSRDVASLAKGHDIRLIGPGAFGVVRTGLGLNATLSDAAALPGRLALVAQSGAVCTAMLDFARPHGIGFSSVLSVGGVLDVDFGELLDALVEDIDTDGILLYVEQVHDARRFLSALRSAARTKPVVLLKAGRSAESAPPRGPDPDAVFDAAMRRCGTVRVRTYTQLFAAARLLGTGRIPRGDRIAVVANGRGPAMLAADSARDAGIELAKLGPRTVEALDAILPEASARANPVDVRGDAPPARFAGAIGAVLADANVDAVVALHVPRPVDSPTDAARAVAAVARGSGKPVLGAWLGAIERPEAHDALDAGGVADFYTPENAVEAFAFLASYRRHQELLLEVPSPQPEPEAPDVTAVERLRESIGERRSLDAAELTTLLGAFHLPAPRVALVETLAEARAAGRRLGFPVMLAVDRPASQPAVERGPLADGRALARAWAMLHEDARAANASPGIVLRKAAVVSGARVLAIRVVRDAVFGPVIVLGPGDRDSIGPQVQALALPPLNRRLALDLVAGMFSAGVAREVPADAEPLVRLLVGLSTLVCFCPFVRELELDPVLVGSRAAAISCARVVVDPRRKATRGYGHMAIHPYPVELARTLTLSDGATIEVRPIRPEDATLERSFVAGLSEESRYFRFFYRLHELTPQMLARFTQVDYDREMALVAVAPDPAAEAASRFVGVARYIANPDGESAEFAVVTADDWQRRGIARVLMTDLIACARKRGLARLEGAVLRANHGMLRFTASLGFSVADDPDDPEQVIVSLPLAGAAARSK